MESPEEVAGAASYSSADGAATTKTPFTKRKRTKRLRSFSSLPPAAPPPPPNEEDYFSTSTTTTTEEEEDMAHCLILLAQGRTAAAGSSLVFECKTCNKCFPSFQALGGHRASHKKPKPAAAAKADAMDHDDVGLEINRVAHSASSTAAPPPAPAPANKQLRVHECSICGSEFASGQALGGHMRRHRPAGGPTAASPESPEAANSGSKKCMLSLDLNLPPAPSEENANSTADAFAFVDRRPLALVDCHY